MKIFSVNITKGGCGKTTTVQILAELLSKEYGKKVLCVDTDPQCNLTTVSGLDIMKCQEHNLYSLLHGESTLEQCIKKSTYYDIIPGSLKLAYADMEFNQVDWEYTLKERLEHAQYDVLLIDTPPALGKLNLMSLIASNSVIIPAECSYLAMIGLDQLSDTIASVQKRKNPELKIEGILLIKYDARANLTETVLNGFEKMAKQMNTTVFNSKIRETVRVKEAQSMRQPLIDWEDKCTAVIDYKEFTNEIIKAL